MKKLPLTIMAVLFIITGCTNSNASEGIPYDSENLQTQLEETSYQPKLPTRFPFEVEDARFSPTPTMGEEKVFNFTFIGADKAVELMTFNGNSMNLAMETEAVDIGSIEGEYGENVVNGQETTVRRLIWKEEEVVYQLSSGNVNGNEGATKEELIDIAKSFE